MYNNPDFYVEKDALEIANEIVKFFEKEIARVIQKSYANRHWTPISMELRHIVIDEISRIFFNKMLELKQIQKDNDWRYKAQDETYPELKEDLKNWL